MKYSIFHLDRMKQKEALRICTCYRRLHLPLIDWNISRQHNNHGITNWLKIISREKCLFLKLLSQAWVKEKILSPHEGLTIFETQKFFFVSCSRQDKKNIFPYFFTELKTCHLSCSIKKLEHRAQLFQGWLTLTQQAWD